MVMSRKIAALSVLVLAFITADDRQRHSAAKRRQISKEDAKEMAGRYLLETVQRSTTLGDYKWKAS